MVHTPSGMAKHGHSPGVNCLFETCMEHLSIICSSVRQGCAFLDEAV